jgi:1-acyl-sn-glycerol-3-phosphate acyltransferase
MSKTAPVASTRASADIDAVEVFFVTGAASGIGRHWAKALVREKDERRRLVLADLDEVGLRSAFRESETVCLRALDVRSVEQWRRVVADTVRRFGRIDYLFNIAGGGRPGPFLDVPMEDVDAQIDLNLKGPIYGMKTVGPIMVRQGRGHIVNVSSLAGIAPTPGNALYSAAKTGLRAVSIASAIRLREKGVRVTVVCPDLVDTPTVERHLSLDPEDVALIYSGPGPLGVEDVEGAFRTALRTGRLEIALPTWRGWLVKVNNLVPPLMPRLYRPLMHKGLVNLEALRRERAGGAPVRLPGRVAALRRVVHLVMRRLARIEIAGVDNVPRQGAALLVFNQLSILDTPLVTMLGGRADVTGLVARDYRRRPMYRLLLEAGGSIWLRRGAADHQALKAALAALSDGWLVAISPEGRRSPTAALVEAKHGPAFLARRANVPIVPVAITNTHRVGSSLRRLRRARVTVTIGEPFRLGEGPGRRRQDVLRADTDLIMRRLAALLPPDYRGVYADPSPVAVGAQP